LHNTQKAPRDEGWADASNNGFLLLFLVWRKHQFDEQLIDNSLHGLVCGVAIALGCEGIKLIKEDYAWRGCLAPDPDGIASFVKRVEQASQEKTKIKQSVDDSTAGRPLSPSAPIRQRIC